ncbi:hypothetical protein EU546_08515, partial [Candidatus Thorarchaeota archaeon]
MEPVGTITMYFPFMDSETRDIIQTVMDEADHYHDFVHELNRRVCEEETTELAVFFATHHAVVLSDFNLLDRLARKYGKLAIIRPNLLIASALKGRDEDFQKARDAADYVISKNPPLWLHLEMLVNKLEAELFGYPVLFHVDSRDEIEEILERNPDLEFYKSRLYHFLSVRANKDGDMDTALEYLEQAIASSEEHNDLNRYARVVRTKAVFIQGRDIKQSVLLLERAGRALESLGDSDGFSDVLFQQGKIMAVRGEYNQAITHI